MFKPDVSCLDEGLDICNALAWLCWTVMDSADDACSPLSEAAKMLI